MALSLQRYRCPYESQSQSQVTIILNKRMQRELKWSPRVLSKNIGGFLPQHLIIEILSRLPVKSLLKFRAVCKTWKSIIKHPHFISKHMQNYYSNKDDNHGCLITQYEVTQAGELEVRELLLDDKSRRVLASQVIRTPEYNTYICGQCDGIYYVWCWCYNRRFLWNPALNEFKVLPPIIRNPNLPSHVIACRFENYGFGYDPITKDYKVVVTAGSSDTTKEHDYDYDHRLHYPLSVFIYSLRDDCWRYWGDMSKYFYLRRNKCYIFVNDTVYWLGTTDSYSCTDCDVVVGFNLATERYQELESPRYDTPATRCPALAVCHGSLALLVNYSEKNCFDMWCFDEQQWSMKCTINFDLSFYCQPVGHWNDNKIVFESDKKLIMYDVETREKWYLKNQKKYDNGRCSNISAYKESLVSVLDRKMWSRQRKGGASQT